MSTPKPENTGVDDVRRAREAIALQHSGNLAEHAAESTRIAEELRESLHLGPVVQPAPRQKPRFAAGG